MIREIRPKEPGKTVSLINIRGRKSVNGNPAGSRNIFCITQKRQESKRAWSMRQTPVRNALYAVDTTNYPRGRRYKCTVCGFEGYRYGIASFNMLRKKISDLKTPVFRFAHVQSFPRYRKRVIDTACVAAPTWSQLARL